MNFRERYQYNLKTDLVGRGGFAKVYKAYDTLREQTVALKFFKSDLSEKYSLFKEIKRVINFDHPNICKYYDIAILETVNSIGEDERMEVGILEYLDGGDIKSFLKDHPQHSKKLLVDILAGLSYLHKNNLIHRDLKPSNILIKNNNTGPVAKITDFGISKALDSNTSKSSDLLGTIEYMSPEQFNPDKYGIDKKISYNLDLWSWACLAYEIIQGESLFGSRTSGNSTEQILTNILHEDYQKKLDHLPFPYNEALKKCLVKDAKERIGNADEIIEILKSTEKKHQISEDTKVISPLFVATAIKEPVINPEPHKPVVGKLNTPAPPIKNEIKKSRSPEKNNFPKILISAFVIVLVLTIVVVTVFNSKSGSSENSNQPNGVSNLSLSVDSTDVSEIETRKFTSKDSSSSSLVNETIPDTDGDGVKDDTDKEKNTKKSCFPVDKNGVGKCPERIQAQKGSVAIIQFAYNSTRLDDGAKSKLSRLATMCREQPELKFKVIAYGVSTVATQQRAWDHANAVINYLVEMEGISADRFTMEMAQKDGDYVDIIRLDE